MAVATHGTRPAIDVHHHMVPPVYLERAGDKVRAIANITGDAFQWTPEKSLRQLDESGIAAAVLSMSAPGIWFGDIAETRDLARLSNEYGAEVAATHPRFGYFATLPLPDIDASLAEIDYALDKLGADGVGFLSSYEDMWLGDPRLEPVMAELDRRGAVAFVHPTVPRASRGIVPGLDDPFLEFLFDSTRTLTHMVVTGMLARHPRIRFIFTHGGAATPSVAHRVAMGLRMIHGAAAPDARALYASVFYDVANAGIEINLAGLTQLTDRSHILFGSDYPYVPVSVTAKQLVDSRLGAANSPAWQGGDARLLFPRFAGL